MRKFVLDIRDRLWIRQFKVKKWANDRAFDRRSIRMLKTLNERPLTRNPNAIQIDSGCEPRLTALSPTSLIQ